MSVLDKGGPLPRIQVANLQVGDLIRPASGSSYQRVTNIERGERSSWITYGNGARIRPRNGKLIVVAVTQEEAQRTGMEEAHQT